MNALSLLAILPTVCLLKSHGVSRVLQSIRRKQTRGLFFIHELQVFDPTSFLVYFSYFYSVKPIMWKRRIPLDWFQLLYVCYIALICSRFLKLINFHA